MLGVVPDAIVWIALIGGCAATGAGAAAVFYALDWYRMKHR